MAFVLAEIYLSSVTPPSPLLTVSESTAVGLSGWGCWENVDMAIMTWAYLTSRLKIRCLLKNTAKKFWTEEERERERADKGRERGKGGWRE